MSEQKVILITGASGGIGAVLARNFARNGHRIVINYLKSEKQAFALRDEIVDEYGQEVALAIQADIANRLEAKRMFDVAYEQFGRLDVLINNAGINRDKPFLEMTDEMWSAVISTILSGTFICSQEFALRFSGEEGHIINIGALTGISGRKNGVNYCSARAGVLTLTKCLALELAPRIRVNCVTPGYIATEEVVERYQLHKKENYEQAISAIPLGALGTPEDIFRMVDFLVNESTYITGQNFLVDGGKLMR